MSRRQELIELDTRSCARAAARTSWCSTTASTTSAPRSNSACRYSAEREQARVRVRAGTRARSFELRARVEKRISPPKASSFAKASISWRWWTGLSRRRIRPRSNTSRLTRPRAARRVSTPRTVDRRGALEGVWVSGHLRLGQVSIHATPKPLTKFEERIRAGIKNNAFESRIRETQLAIPPIVDSAMATIAPGRFVDAAALFKGDTMSVFVDRIGHNTEASVPKIVDAFWPALEAAVQRSREGAAAEAPANVRRRTQ